MNRKQLASQLSLRRNELDSLLAKLTFDGLQIDPLADDIPDNVAEILLAQKNTSQPQIEAEASPLKPKRGRNKKGGALAKAASEAIEETTSKNAHAFQSAIDQLTKLKVLEGFGIGNQLSAAMWTGIQLGESEANAARLDEYVSTLTNQIKANSEGFDPRAIASELGIDLDDISLGKSQGIKVDLSAEMLRI